ncbi:maltooligosyl trehalose synthase [Acidothermus cellulolyticus 11B]|uniref:Maltooligosyl trehalose synthase n=1 Tax=Acidothermus cellulolyticus (strain ATCC 43068 / DSM 8971 / 11B) TaxID=351607 RepID=A0LUN5_ACIC1|nr:malto-oligosyltrehalose synthase [Acidothermus cellulolyticus]ABK53145.1 maltooligosyl trehalose synthase [Acidothermus cellulolyticus 11B]
MSSNADSTRRRGRTPTATYRIQLRPDFGFADVAALASYFADLGVSHVYLSPVLEAVPGSTHGYDVIDPTRLRQEFGGEAAFTAMREALAAAGVGIVVDIVPNHLAIPVPEWQNPAFWSVLREGRHSPFAAWFDIDWDAGDGRIVLPFLDGPLTENLGHFSVVTDDEHGAMLAYYDHRFPLAAGTEQLPVAEALDRQHYRLIDWRAGPQERNYRRFVDIDQLIAVRVDDPTVWDATHAVIVDLACRELIDGLRIDHIDGLHDPAGYLRRLQNVTGVDWVVAEKILTLNEELPADWPIAGTTGYDALAVLNGLLIDPDGYRRIRRCYADLAHMTAERTEVVTESKRAALAAFAGDIERLADALSGEAGCAPAVARDLLHRILLDLPVYRPYPSDPTSMTALHAAVRQAVGAHADAADCARFLAAAVRDGRPVGARFGQLAAGVYAKGVEDTAFYRDIALLAVNEVGCDPRRPSCSVAEFHDFMARLEAHHPTTMTTLSTHDTKRSEDVRARLAVLSELPEEWDTCVRRLSTLSTALGCPDEHAAYLVVQTLVGAWPLDLRRTATYVRKALREAKRATSWQHPNARYESAVASYLDAVFASADFLGRIEEFVNRLAPYGRANSLSQKLLQLTMPGVPDVYQGCERTSLRLVDPDNRAPVDFAACRAALDEFLDPKVRLTATVLRLRRRHPEWFTGYHPLVADGPAADHLVAFHRDGPVVTVAGRLTARLRAAGGWRETTVHIPAGTWVDALSGRECDGGEHAVGSLLGAAPVALLVPAVEVTA